MGKVMYLKDRNYITLIQNHSKRQTNGLKLLRVCLYIYIYIVQSILFGDSTTILKTFALKLWKQNMEMASPKIKPLNHSGSEELGKYFPYMGLALKKL